MAAMDGDTSQAQSTLYVSLLAQAIETGRLTCGRQDFTIRPDPLLAHFKERDVLNVARRMCSALYMGYYPDMLQKGQWNTQCAAHQKLSKQLKVDFDVYLCVLEVQTRKHPNILSQVTKYGFKLMED